MPTIEQVCKQLFSDPKWISKCLIGTVISFIPIVNILALGYMFQLVKQGRNGQPFELPEWKDWQLFLMDGLVMLVALIVFAAVPMFLAFFLFSTSLAAQMGMLVMIPVSFFSLPLTVAALVLYLENENFAEVFNFEALIGIMKSNFIQYSVPTLAFVGLIVVCFPLLSVPYFMGGLVYFYYLPMVYTSAQVSR